MVELQFGPAEAGLVHLPEVTVKGDNMLVTKRANGKRKWEEEEGECRYIWLERRASPRSDANAGTVTARYESGVLTVTVKKQPPSEKKTKSVQVAIT
uniref:Uncharacterized protein n=1 Tax=Aegilops tauschii TaxID=37682 RepID=N1QSX5_AEGTA